MVCGLPPAGWAGEAVGRAGAGEGLGTVLSAASARRAAASAAEFAAAVCELLFSNDSTMASWFASTRWSGAAGSNSDSADFRSRWASWSASDANLALSRAVIAS